SRWLYYAHGQDLITVTDEHVRNARHAYYGMTSYTDDKVGSLLETLEAAGLAEDTIVVFTSDHGEMLGERGMWYKQYFYEDSVRVPLIIRDPNSDKTGSVSELVSLIDLLPTFMDIASDGNPPETPGPLDGRSLSGFLNGNIDDWDNKVIAEYTGEGVIAPCRMVRRDNYKYIYTHGHPPLLYDLDADPLEVDNLAGQPEVADVENAMAAEIVDDWNPDEIAGNCIQSQKDRMFIQNSTGGDPTWAFLSRQGDAGRYVRNAGATQTKTKARYPFVEPTPFER
ncbi:MAG: sulfatase-like hydrolase/transferase, partial [Rhodospirillaceae bacterium]|nr:sulfatase-like hydrolase/transferase [Rhodospirillaceae bacterium]